MQNNFETNTYTEAELDTFVSTYLSSGKDKSKAYRAIRPDKGATSVSTNSTFLLALPEIQEEIEYRLKLQAKKSMITEQRILEELACIAFFDVKDLLNDDGSLKPISEIPEKARKAISGLELVELYHNSAGKGDVKIPKGMAKKLKINSKEKALELLGKYFSMFTEKIQVEGGETHIHYNIGKFDVEDRIKQLRGDSIEDALQ